jgi:hypothetical protein
MSLEREIAKSRDISHVVTYVCQRDVKLVEKTTRVVLVNLVLFF